MLKFDEMDGCYYWDKGNWHQLSRNFWTSEFECKCSRDSCRTQRIKASLVQKLQDIRDDLDTALTVTSAFRCREHQESLRQKGYETAVKQSTHERGWAADIRTKDQEALKKACEVRFRAIGYANTFIHVDERMDKIRRWFYSSR